jgi:hypothetical protein
MTSLLHIRIRCRKSLIQACPTIVFEDETIGTEAGEASKGIDALMTAGLEVGTFVDI